jgi:isopentenyl-diphosphate delta-isomerase
MGTAMGMIDEQVVLLDEDGAAIGSVSKAAVHGLDTPLHLAFSCHVRNAAGEVLVTRRALGKKSWPGVWTNSFCGHPRPAEPLLDAVHRRADFELGLQLRDVELALPLFRYRASDASGVVENEVCPVYLAVADGDPDPNHEEVAEFAWVDPMTLGESIRLTPWAFSPWLVLQAQHLEFLAGTAPASLMSATRTPDSRTPESRSAVA